MRTLVDNYGRSFPYLRLAGHGLHQGLTGITPHLASIGG